MHFQMSTFILNDSRAKIFWSNEITITIWSHAHLHQNHIGCLLKFQFWTSYSDLMNQNARDEGLEMEENNRTAF